jgi:UDP-galactopyranose mutase
MQFDWVVVGAGFSGCVLAERLASQLDQRVLLIEKRDHIGGNAYDFYNEHGVLLHKYGPHIFHTNAKRIFDYLSNFTEWRPYQHRVLAMIDGIETPLPFNLNSMHKVFSRSLAEKLESKLIEAYGFNVQVPILKLREHENADLKFLADYIYNNVFLNYTTKMWDLKPEQLAASVTARVPVSVSRDDRYFRDTFQAMPKNGYSEMFKKMLSHPKIHVLTNTDYRDVVAEIRYRKLAYTGPIDAYFDYAHGELPYRSLNFKFETFDQPTVQKAGTVNYPNEYDFTRITDQKILTGQTGLLKSTTVTEFPTAYQRGVNDPYYPIPREENRAIFEKYATEAKALQGSVFFAGRLADYMYYNMDQVVARALACFEKEIVGAVEKSPNLKPPTPAPV